MTTKKFVAVALMGSVFAATAAFAATTIKTYEDLQSISSIALVELNNDGGRQALLTQDLLLSDGQFGYCGNNNLYGPGTVFYANSLVYIYIKRAPTSTPTPAPATPTNPTSDDKKVEAIEVKTFEELAAISSTPLQDNGDGGRGATLIRPIKVAAGQKVLCGSETPLEEGAVVEAGQFIYMWLAPEGYGLEAISNLKGLRKEGSLEAEADGIWYSYLPDGLMKVDLEVFGVINVDDPSDDISDGLLREETAYYLCVLEEYKNFVPQDDSQLSVLCRPDDAPVKKELDRPEGEPARQNWHVRIPFDWKKADNCRVLNGSNSPQPAGSIQKGGSLLYISVQTLTDPDRGGNGSGGGGGGCDAGFGLIALAAVTPLVLRKQRR